MTSMNGIVPTLTALKVGAKIFWKHGVKDQPIPDSSDFRTGEMLVNLLVLVTILAALFCRLKFERLL